MKLKQFVAASTMAAMFFCSMIQAVAADVTPVGITPSANVATAVHVNVARAAAKAAKGEVLNPNHDAGDQEVSDYIRAAQFELSAKLEDDAYTQFGFDFSGCSYLDVWKIANKANEFGQKTYDNNVISDFMGICGELEKPYADAPVNQQITSYWQKPYGIYLKDDEAWVLTVNKIGKEYRLVMWHSDLNPKAHNRQPTVAVCPDVTSGFIINESTVRPYTLLDVQVSDIAIPTEELYPVSVQVNRWHEPSAREVMSDARQKQLETAAKSTFQLNLAGYQFTDIDTLADTDEKTSSLKQIYNGVIKAQAADNALPPFGVYQKGQEVITLQAAENGALIIKRFSLTSKSVTTPTETKISTPNIV